MLKMPTSITAINKIFVQLTMCTLYPREPQEQLAWLRNGMAIVVRAMSKLESPGALRCNFHLFTIAKYLFSSTVNSPSSPQTSALLLLFHLCMRVMPFKFRFNLREICAIVFTICALLCPPPLLFNLHSQFPFYSHIIYMDICSLTYLSVYIQNQIFYMRI